MNESKYISVIVISFNGMEFIENCLRTLYLSIKNSDAEIIVIDNGSIDGTVELSESKFANLILVKNKSNLGFAKAVNQGLEIAKGEYILILNQDTRIIGRAIEELAERLKSDTNIGTIGPKFIGFDGQLQKACRTFPRYRDLAYNFSGLSNLFPKSKRFSFWKMGWFDHLSEKEVDQPMGAALMVKRSVLEKIGNFDERFRIFFNDVDFCRRVKAAGYINLYYPTAVIEHYYGGTIKKMKPQMVLEWHRAISIYFIKYSSNGFKKIIALCFKAVMTLLAYPRALYHKIVSG